MNTKVCFKAKVSKNSETTLKVGNYSILDLLALNYNVSFSFGLYKENILVAFSKLWLWFIVLC